MKKTFLRFVSTALAAVMLFGCMNIGVFAADFADEQNTVTLTAPAPSVATQEGVDAPSAKAVVNKTIASTIAGSKTEFTAAEKAVLNALALKSGEFSYTEIGLGAEENVTMAITDVANTYTVKANAIDSGLANQWVPVGGRAICEDGDVAFALTNGEGIFTAEKIDHVEIDYELVISEISADTASFFANLPYTLATEAVAQKDVLDYYAQDKIYNKLADFATYMSVLDLIKGSFGEAAQAAIASLVANCIHETADGKSLYFAEYLAEYKAKGLAYYYSEGAYEALNAQLKLVRDAINVICADPKFDEIFVAMDSLMPAQNLLEKKDAIEEIKTALNEKELVPVNANIDRASAYLPALATAVEAAIGNSSEKTVSDVIVAKSISAVAPDKTTVSIVVSVVNKDGIVIDTVTESITYEIGAILTENDAQDLEDLVSDMEAELDIDTDNYVCTPDGAALPKEGDTIAAPVVVSYVWAPLSYTIVIDGIEDQILYADGSGLTIKLPGTGTIEEKYIYTIGAAEIPVGVEDKNYTFADISALKDLCTDGTLVIKRTVLNAAREDILDFIDAMNEAMANKASVVVNGVKVPVISFIPVEDAGGEISVVLRITPYLTGIDYQGLILDVVKVLTIDGNPFGTLKINGKTLFDGKVYLQTVIDTVLSDNFGMDAVCNMIDANGNIIDITATESAFANVSVIDTEYPIANATQLGGKLIGAELQADGFVFPFYVTFEDYDQMAGTLIKVEKAFETVKDNVNITAENGVLNVELVMPASFSAYYLAELLVMEQADLANIENMQLEEALAFMMSIVKPLVADEDFTLEVIENTAAKAGVNVDLSKYVTEAQFATVRKALNYLFTKGELESEAAGTTYSATVSYKIRDILINRFNIDDMFLALVAEADVNSKGVSLSFSITDNTIETRDYDALVIDPSSLDLGMLTTTSDLATVLANAKENTIVVLLQDVTLSSDVVIPNRVFINLNGYTINGNMTTSAAVRITNSNLAPEKCGGVNGALSGSFIITGGDYSADVTSMVKQGYEVVDGCVENKLYAASKDADGNITIAIKGDFLNLDNIPATRDSLKDFVVDVAFDIALNMFTAASVTVDGNNIYSIELNNVLGMLNGSKKDIANAALDCISFEGITAVANVLLADLVDFASMRDALVSGEAITSYTMETKGWNVTPEIVGDADKYIAFNVVPTEETKTVTIDVVFAEMTEDDYVAAYNLFDGFAKTVSFNELTVNIGGIGYADGKPTVDLTGAIDVAVDFSEDYRYGALILAAVAYTEEGEARDVYTDGLYYLFGGNKDAFAESLDAITSAQIIKALGVLATVNCEDMLAEIGFDNQAEIIALADIYDELLEIANKLVAYIGVKGNSTTLGACKVADTMAEYAFARENVKGFDVDFSIIVMDEETALDPEIVDIKFSEYLDEDLIKNGYVTGKYIFVDASYKGITVSDLNFALDLTITHTDNWTARVSGKDYGELVCTGDVLVIETDTVNGTEKLGSYVVIILGDTNCNGKADAGDAVLMAKHYVGKETMNAFAELATDINANYKIDAGDAVKVTDKYINWNNYVSALD